MGARLAGGGNDELKALALASSLVEKVSERFALLKLMVFILVEVCLSVC